MALSQHSDPENALSCFITCPAHQVLHIQVASTKLVAQVRSSPALQHQPGQPLPFPPLQQCHCTWFNRCSPGWWDEHSPCRDLSAPQVPRGDFFLTLQHCILRTAGFDLGFYTLTRAGTINPNDFQLHKRNLLLENTEFFTYPWHYLESSLDSKTQPPAQTRSQIYLQSKRASLQSNDDGASFGSAFQTLPQHPLPITTCHFEMPVPLSS